MFKRTNDGIIQVTDETRVKFRTNISKAILDQLQELASQHDSHVNYLIENGLERLLAQGVITYNKETRPKDRVQYKTSYDKKLLESVKKFAKDHHLFINDVIEHSVQFIDFENVKSKGYRNRVV